MCKAMVEELMKGPPDFAIERECTICSVPM